MKTPVVVTASFLSVVFALLSTAYAGSPVAIPVGSYPRSVAVNPVTNRVYVTNNGGSTVSVIDGNANVVVATVTVGVSPNDIDVDWETNTVYVANYNANSLSVIDGAANTVKGTVAALFQGASHPWGVTVNSSTHKIFVSNSIGSEVAIIDGTKNSLTRVQVGNCPLGMALNSIKNLIYVANGCSGTISVIDGVSGMVTNTFNLPSGAAAAAVAFDPALDRLFVVDSRNSVVYVLDASSGSLLSTITGGAQSFREPSDVAVLQSGKTILVSDFLRNIVVEINENTYAVESALTGGSEPNGIAVNHTTGNIYVVETNAFAVDVYSQ
jgi:YVTN family beta-propeller protein